jgi:acyl carrier protein
MERQELEQRIKKVTAAVLNVDADSIELENNFAEDLGAESVQSVELVAGFEEEFDIEMDEDEALSVDTVGGAVDYISTYVE